MTTYKIESGAGIYFGLYEATSARDALNQLYDEAGYDYQLNPPPAGHLIVTEATPEDMGL